MSRRLLTSIIVPTMMYIYFLYLADNLPSDIVSGQSISSYWGFIGTPVPAVYACRSMRPSFRQHRQTVVAHHLLIVGMQITFHHETNDGGIASQALLQNGVPYLFLVPCVCENCMAAIHHQHRLRSARRNCLQAALMLSRS
jgi:hypothetical protein